MSNRRRPGIHLPIATLARRHAATALLEERRVSDDRILPSAILLPGARHNHDVKDLRRMGGVPD